MIQIRKKANSLKAVQFTGTLASALEVLEFLFTEIPDLCLEVQYSYTHSPGPGQPNLPMYVILVGDAERIDPEYYVFVERAGDARWVRSIHKNTLDRDYIVEMDNQNGTTA